MPHSSGGGSHGGGSHGGSGFHGGSHHSGSGRSYNRFSRRPFVGGRRFVYYHHCRPYFIYSNVAPGSVSIVQSWFGIVITFFMLLLPFLIALLTGFHTPTRLSTYYNTEIVIEDNADVLTSEQEESLKERYQSFLDKTGITPAFVSTNDRESSMTLEHYAYRTYLSKFSDEKHWLIVYEGGENWAFEGMQGNDTDGILTEKVTKNFINTLYKSLMNHVNIGDALVDVFDKTTPHIMDRTFSIDSEFTKIIIVWSVLALPIFVLSIFGLINSYRMKDAKECPEDAKLKKCPYCDTPYYANTVKKCPKCGANLAENDYFDSLEKEKDFNPDKELNK